MSEYCLAVNWSYEYDKEGTWFDRESGTVSYPLTAGASYPLPHISKKSLDIRKVEICGDEVAVELSVDRRTVSVNGIGVAAKAYVSDSYSVAGDCVDQSLSLEITIEKQ